MTIVPYLGRILSETCLYSSQSPKGLSVDSESIVLVDSYVTAYQSIKVIRLAWKELTLRPFPLSTQFIIILLPHGFFLDGLPGFVQPRPNFPIYVSMKWTYVSSDKDLVIGG